MLEQRFKDVKATRAPDLWPDIERREPGPPRHEVPWDRLGTAALAFAVAAAGIAFAARAFFGEDPRPGSALDTKIAFVVKEHPAAVYTMNLDGTDIRKVVEGRDPAWSPDGTRIAFRRGRTDEPGGLMNRIYLADVDGSNVRTIYEGSGGEPGGAGAPAWSPDGSQIAFAEIDGLRVMEADGSGVRLVVPNEEIHDCYATEPSWSPYGTRIAFAARCSGGDLGIFLVRTDGSDLRQLTGKVVVDGSGLSDTPPYLDSYPAWSPDGSRIAFVRRLEQPPLAPASIYVMEADGSDATKVSDAPHEGFYEYAPTWSPDSSRIAFTDAVDGRIYLTNADGTGLRPITEPGLDACCPAWQPDPSIEPPALEPVVQVTPRIAASIPVGPFPSAIAVGEGAVWVGVPAQDGSGSGELVRIDPATNEVVARIEFDHWPDKVATGAGSVWVAGVTNTVGPSGQTSDFHSAVVQIDPSSNQILASTAIPGGIPSDIEAGESGVWVALQTDNRDGEIVHLDPTTSEETTRIELSAAPYRILLDGEALWAITDGPEGLVKIDPVTRKVTAALPVRVPMVLDAAVGDGAVWIGSWLSAFDPTVGTGYGDRVVAVGVDAATYEVDYGPVFPSANGPTFRPFAATLGGVWFLGNDGISRLNTDTMEVDAVVELEEDPIVTEFAVLDEPTRTIWIANYEDTVTRIELG
jgi:Tol biopolymer transport system component